MAQNARAEEDEKEINGQSGSIRAADCRFEPLHIYKYTHTQRAYTQRTHGADESHHRPTGLVWRGERERERERKCVCVCVFV